MRPVSQLRSLLRTAAAVVIVGSCGEASASTGPSSCAPTCQYSDCYAPTPTFEITSPRLAIGIGDTVQLSIADNSAATWAVLTPGIATISASGLVVGTASGTATLRATRNSGTPISDFLNIDVFASICRATDATSEIAAGDSVNGVLDGNSCGIEAPPNLDHWPAEQTWPDIVPAGRVAKGWRIEVPYSQSVRFELRTGGYLPVLYVTDEFLVPRMARANRSGVATTAVPFLPPGSYIVWASSFPARTTGSFALAVHSAATCAPEGHTADTISVQQSLLGALAVTDCYLRTGQPADVWRLNLATPERLRIFLSGAGANDGASVVLLEPAGGYWWFLDGIELNAGVHTLLVFGERPGDYQLNVIRCLQPVGLTCMP